MNDAKVNQGLALQNYLKRKKKSMSSIASELGISRTKLTSLTSKPVLSLLERHALRSIYTLPPDFFKGNGEILEYGVVFEKNLSSFMHLPKESQIEHFLKDYYEPIINRIKKANNSVLVNDYFGLSEMKDEKVFGYQNFVKQRDKYFMDLTESIISKKRKNPNFQYDRLIDMPVNYFRHQYDKVSIIEKISTTLILMTPEYFKHIATLLSEEDKDKVSYIKLAISIRTDNYTSNIIIDDHTLIEETERFSNTTGIGYSPETIKITVSHQEKTEKDGFGIQIRNRKLELQNRISLNKNNENHIKLEDLEYILDWSLNSLDNKIKVISDIGPEILKSKSLKDHYDEIFKYFPECLLKVNSLKTEEMYECLRKKKIKLNLNRKNLMMKQALFNDLK